MATEELLLRLRQESGFFVNNVDQYINRENSKSDSVLMGKRKGKKSSAAKAVTNDALVHEESLQSSVSGNLESESEAFVHKVNGDAVVPVDVKDETAGSIENSLKDLEFRLNEEIRRRKEVEDRLKEKEQQVADCKSAHIALQQSCQEKDANIANLQLTSETDSNTKAKYEEQIQQLQDEISRLPQLFSELEKASGELEKCQERVLELEEELQEAIEERDKFDDQLVAENRRSQLSRQSVLEEMQEALATMETSVNLSLDERSELKAENERLSVERDQMQQELISLMNRIADMEQLNKDWSTRVAEETRLRLEAERQLQELQLENECQQKSNATIDFERMEELLSEKEHLEEELNTTIERLQEQRRNHLSELTIEEEKMTELHSEVRSLKAELLELTADHEQKIASVQTVAQQELEKVVMERKAQDRNMEALTQKLDQSNLSMKEKDIQIVELRADVKAYMESSEEQRLDLLSLRKQLDEQNGQLDTLRTGLKDKELEHEKLKVKLEAGKERQLQYETDRDTEAERHTFELETLKQELRQKELEHEKLTDQLEAEKERQLQYTKDRDAETERYTVEMATLRQVLIDKELELEKLKEKLEAGEERQLQYTTDRDTEILKYTVELETLREDLKEKELEHEKLIQKLEADKQIQMQYEKDKDAEAQILGEMDIEMKEYKQKMNVIVEENKDLVNRITESERLLTVWQTDKEVLCRQLTDVEGEKEMLKARCEALVLESGRALKMAVEKSQTRAPEVTREELKQLREDSVRLEAELRIAHETIDALQDSLMELRSVASVQETCAVKARNESERLQQELERACFEKEQAVLANDGRDSAAHILLLESQIARNRETHAEQMEQITEELRTAEERARLLEQDCQQKKVENVDLTQEMKRWRGRFEETSQEVESLGRAIAEVQKLETVIDETKKEWTSSEEQLMASRSTTDGLERENTELRQRLAEVQQQLQDRTNRLIQHGETKMDSTLRIVDLESQLTAITRARDNLVRHLHTTGYTITHDTYEVIPLRESAGSDRLIDGPTMLEPSSSTQVRIPMERDSNVAPATSMTPIEDIGDEDDMWADFAVPPSQRFLPASAPLLTMLERVSRYLRLARHRPRRALLSYARYALAAYFIFVHFLLLHCWFM